MKTIYALKSSAEANNHSFLIVADGWNGVKMRSFFVIACYCIAMSLFRASALTQIQTEETNGVMWRFAIGTDGAVIESGEDGKSAINPSFEGELTIPIRLGGYGVDEIGNDAFRGCGAITAITMPKTISRVCANAFFDCISIESLNFPISCTNIGPQACKGMSRLKTVRIEGYVSSISHRLFENCYRLVSVELGKGVKNVENMAFRRCSSLERIVFPESLESMDSISEIFDGAKSLKEIVFMGPPPKGMGHELPSKCTLRYHKKYEAEWLRWQKDNPNAKIDMLLHKSALERIDFSEDIVSTTNILQWIHQEDALDDNSSTTQQYSALDNAKLNDCISEMAKKHISEKGLVVQWLELAKNLHYEWIRQEILKAASVASIYSGDITLYKEKIAPHLFEKQRFEDSLYTSCVECSGLGSLDDVCQHCHETGKCQRQGCNNGKIEIRVKQFSTATLDIPPSVKKQKKCTSCDGTGLCRYCKGSGHLKIACTKCGGKRRKIVKSHLVDIYQDYVIKILMQINDQNDMANQNATPASSDNEFDCFSQNGNEESGCLVSNWRVSSSVSAFDDSTTYLASCNARDGIYGYDGTPTLMIRFLEGKTSIYITYPRFFYIGNRTIPVTIRFGHHAPNTVSCGISTDYEAVFLPFSFREFWNAIEKVDKIAVRLTPYGKTPVTSSFDVSGFSYSVPSQMIKAFLSGDK